LAVGFLLLIGFCAPFASCQAAAAAASTDPRNYDATDFGGRIMLGPDWLFAPGDNPAWAAANLDDSQWRTISSDKPLSTYGIRDIHYAWYRMHIHLRPGTRYLAVGMFRIGGGYEVYANGTRIGGGGPMNRSTSQEQRFLLALPVPDGLISTGDLTLAVRSRFDLGFVASPFGPDSIHLVSEESAPILASFVAAHLAGPPALLSGIALIVGLIALALYFALRGQLEYLAIAVCLFAASAVAGILVWFSLVSSSFPLFYVQFSLIGLEMVALIEFVRLVLHLPRSRWILGLEAVSFLAFLVFPLHDIGLISDTSFFVGFFLPVLSMKIALPALLIRGWRRGNREALLLLPAILLGCFADYWNFLRNIAQYAHADPWLQYLPFSIEFGSYNIDFYRLGDLAFDIAVLIFLVQRTVRIARERDRASAELEAARTTQQLLLARSSHPTPGFHVETIYHPASEVGGDFFLVSSSPNGGLIAVVGDVSGKGLIAAMRVAMILGVLRRESSWEPAQVLRNLNEALQAQGEPGFTTACCVHINQDGTFTLANAGHIAPYIDGREVETPPALPLGLTPDQHYETVSGTLTANQRIVLLSDGVVEARSASGELFGFDRLAPLTLLQAREIADTARAFGQEDDITVVTLARTA